VQNYHLLVSPQSLYQEAINQPEGSHVAREVRQAVGGGRLQGCLFEWVDKASEGSGGLVSAPMRLEGFKEGVCSVAIFGDRVACGTEDCEVKVFSVVTAELVRVFQGHAGRINQVCFVGDGDMLCSVSADGRASLWSVSGGFR